MVQQKLEEKCKEKCDANTLESRMAINKYAKDLVKKLKGYAGSSLQKEWRAISMVLKNKYEDL